MRQLDEEKYQVYLDFIATLMNLQLEKRLSFSAVNGEIGYKMDTDYADGFIAWREKWLV